MIRSPGPSRNRRGPQVTPRRPIERPADPAYEDGDAAPERRSRRPSSTSQAVPLSSATPSTPRLDVATDVSARRRVRQLQKAAENKSLPPVAVPRRLATRIHVGTRWLSGLIVVALTVVLIILLTSRVFYVREIYVGGTKFLTPGEIFARTNLIPPDGNPIHVFWVDAQAVEKNLILDPAIANATVRLDWPPKMVQITITERSPALVWVQAGQRYWVDVAGHVMQYRQDLKDLVQVIVEHPSKDIHLGACPRQGKDELFAPGDCIDLDIVDGILQFKALYPNVTEMVYDPVKGLGYHEGGGWVLWFGNGVDILTKMADYNAIVDKAQASGFRLIEVNVADPDHPYQSVIPAH